MSKKILGLDIGSDAVTAALVVSSLKGARVESAIRLAFQDEEAVEEALHRCLETLHHTMDTSGAVCVAAVPSADVSFRNVRLPFKDDRKIRQVLPFEIEPTLASSIDDLVIDFQTVSSNGHPGTTQIIAAAMEQFRLEAFLKTLSSHHLDPEIVTLGGYCEAICLKETSDTPGCWFCVSVGPCQSTVCIVDSGVILAVRRIEARLDPKDGLENLCRQMEHTRLFCENLNHTDIVPEVVYWAGEQVEEEAWESLIAERFQCRTEKTDLLKRPDFHWAPFSGQSPAGDVRDSALSLALIELTGAKVINFRTGPFALRKKWLEYKGPLLRTAALLFIVFSLGFFQLYAETYTLNREVQRLSAETRAMFTDAFPDVGRIVDPVQQMRVKIQEMRKQIDLAGSPDGEKLKIDLLQSLSSRVPETIDVEITRMVIGPDSMTIGGNTSTFNAVDEIKSRLEEDDLFQNVTINSANLEKSGEQVNFRIRMGL
ncbi:MAG: PilN domain-containing protein [Desulfobacterales bacterium]|nr:PilN domain-containing protein [Desulfobacterales bacterium]